MNRTNLIIGTLVLVCIVLFSYGLFRSGPPQQSLKEISKTLEDNGTAAEAGATPGDGGDIGVTQLPADNTSGTTDSESATADQHSAAGSSTGARQDRFTFQRLQVITDKALPEACLVFSKDLAEKGKVQYEDYVRFESGINPAYEISENRLCFQGLKFATNYRISLRKGLPSATGDKLAFDENIPIELQDRPPFVQFENGLILPRHDGAGVPVTTVNVDTLDIKIYRVGDRLLSQLYSGLVDQRTIYYYERNEVEDDKGELVWSGQMVVNGEKNQTAHTIFDVRKAVPDWDAGVYLLLAEDAADKEKINSYYYSDIASQWIIDSDLGLTTYEGQNGLHVFVRSLQTAEPQANVEVVLVARNNEILARVKSDKTGAVNFPPSVLRGNGGARPVVVMAYDGDKDFNYLDLRRPSFDLSDRGVDGRSVPSEIDGYLYTDRGIYRPGEQVHLVAMVRDRLVNALDDIPLTIKIRRPDGIEYRTLTAAEQKAGASYVKVPLSATAPRGLWQAVAYVDTDAAPVGRAAFEVQDFVPQRLKVEVDTDVNYWQPGDLLTIDVDSRFLYGAPASNLGAEAELKVMLDPNPHPDFDDYKFGRIEEDFDDQVINLQINNTDTDGKTTAIGNVPVMGKTTLPMRGRVKVAVYEPGGRTTWNEIYRPIRANDVVLGIRPGFDGGWVREGTAAGFDVIALDKDGNRIGRENLSYRLVREETYYQWYQENGRWDYESIVRDRTIANGALSVGIDNPEKITQQLDWGQYRLVVTDKDGAAGASYRFYVGWGGTSSTDRPDKVTVSSDKDKYKLGETARLQIKPGVAGKAQLIVASDRIFETKQFDISEAGAELNIPVSDDWGAGAYVMVTVYKPLNAEQKRAPVRAIGLTWLQLDQDDRKLNVSFDVPERVRPRQDVTIPVKVDGIDPGEKTFVTLAAVDEGILQLTRFKTPTPAEYYFGKRRLAIDIRDDYGRLITNVSGAMGELRTGGDAIGGSGLSVVPTRTVALFSGIVPVNAQGEADVAFTVPDFAGELRLMAIAMTADSIGTGEQPLTVRDDVVAEVTLPRFLAPGDETQATLLLHNVDGTAGAYKTAIAVSGAVKPTDGGTEFIYETDLDAEEREQTFVPISGAEPGIGTIALTLTGPDGYKIVRSWPIEVRPAQRPVTLQTVELMAPGDKLDLKADALAPFYADGASVTATLASSRGYDVPGLLRWLDRYPYGCLEQTVSRALPLVYFNDLALLSSVDEDETIKFRVQSAVDRVLDMQSGAGGFGMWGPYDYRSNSWLGTYAMDFLVRAQEHDYVVPNDSIDRGLNWLKEIAGRTSRDHWQRSYAFYVLARSGAANPGDVRYYFDTQLNKIDNALSAAHLAAALHLVGDLARSSVAYQRAMDLLNRPPAKYHVFDYGSRLRDVSGVTALAASTDQTQMLPALFSVSDQFEPNARYTTTQEKSWMLLAAYELAKSRERMTLEISGTDSVKEGDPVFVTPTLGDLATGVSIANKGEKDIWRSVSVQGVPLQPMEPEANGLGLRKSFWTRTGEQVNLSDIKQNDQVVVMIDGQMENNTYREMVVADLLPAGWEIEGIVGAGDTGMAWLPATTGTRMTEARDDRFVAAFDIGAHHRMTDKDGKPILPRFTLAYVARATVPGTYVLPAAEIEDMYAPQIYARTRAGEVTISAP